MHKRKFSQLRPSQWWTQAKIKGGTILLVGVLAAVVSRSFYTSSSVPKSKVVVVETKDTNVMLDETGSIKESGNGKWWLNSGGRVYLDGKVIKTIQGELPIDDKWRVEYANSNPLDTDNGYHPQNVFRLITHGKLLNFSQQVYFQINKDNLSNSLNRDRWSGVFLFNRYQDDNDLYYAGIRMDGAAVIKKKVGGVYRTLAYKKIFPGTYNRTSSPNLLPHNEWVGLKSETINTPNGAVNVKLFMYEDDRGWVQTLEATDSGKTIRSVGHAGIRTDFMDVEFDDYRIEEVGDGN